MVELFSNCSDNLMFVVHEENCSLSKQPDALTNGNAKHDV